MVCNGPDHEVHEDLPEYRPFLSSLARCDKLEVCGWRTTDGRAWHTRGSQIRFETDLSSLEKSTITTKRVISKNGTVRYGEE